MERLVFEPLKDRVGGHKRQLFREALPGFLRR